MSYCINPNCPKQADPLHGTNRICRHCGSQLLLQGRYRAIRLLGEGGFAKTYEVDDLGVSKVLKVLLLQEPKAVLLFQKEAEVLSRLRHPGIPKVDPDGYFTFWPKNSQKPVHCLVMEKINGPNLEEWLYSRDNLAITEDRALDWLRQLTTILHEVHKEKFFHRDIKPANLMLRPNGQVVLIDFGSAREVTGTYLAKMGIGQKGTIIASRGYTPPEQDSGHPVPQSDFFALGRTFVHLLTGKHPLDFYDIRTDELLWRGAAPQVQKPLADLIDQLMARLPGQRPPNTEVILQRLAEIGSSLQQKRGLRRGKPRAPRSPSIGFGKFAEKWLAGGAIALVGCLGFGQAIFYGYFASRISGYSTPDAEPLPVQTPAKAAKNPLKPTANSPKRNSFEKKILLARTLSGHSLDVRSVAISPDSRTIASGSFDATIKIWDLKNGQLLRTLSENSKAEELISSVVISPDGQTLIAGSDSDNGTLKMWNLQTGDLTYTFPKNKPGVSSLAISRDGKTVATGSSDNTIKLWDVGSGTLVSTLLGHSGTVRSVAFSPDGQLLASGSEDGTIKLWNLNGGELLTTLYGHVGMVYSVVFSPNGQTLASGSGDNTIKLWNVGKNCKSTKRCEVTRTLSGHAGTVSSVAFSPDGQVLAAGSLSGRMTLWNWGTGEMLQTLSGHASWIESVAFSPDGGAIATGSGDSTVKIWLVNK